MESKAKTTRDHDEIKAWAEARGGKPAHVADTGSAGDIGILRLEFPGATASNDASLEEITWEQFFEKFDERGLSLLYQEETASGDRSNFNKLLSETTATAQPGKKNRPARKAPAKKAATSKAPAKKSAPARKAPARKAPGKKAARKTTPATKTASVRKTSPSKKKTAAARPAKKAAVRSGRTKPKKTVTKAAAKRGKPPLKRTVAARRPARKTAARKRR